MDRRLYDWACPMAEHSHRPHLHVIAVVPFVDFRGPLTNKMGIRHISERQLQAINVAEMT